MVSSRGLKEQRLDHDSLALNVTGGKKLDCVSNSRSYNFADP